MGTSILVGTVGGLLILLGSFVGYHINTRNGENLVRVGLYCILLSIALLFLPPWAHARDLGQWHGTDPAVGKWYKELMQPDHPLTPCCGEADAYWADEMHVRDGRTFVTVTDDRPDAPLMRPHIDVGTEIEVPDYKLKWDRGNPTGHGVLFLSYAQHVFCYVQPGGV